MGSSFLCNKVMRPIMDDISIVRLNGFVKVDKEQESPLSNIFRCTIISNDSLR